MSNEVIDFGTPSGPECNNTNTPPILNDLPPANGRSVDLTQVDTELSEVRSRVEAYLSCLKTKSNTAELTPTKDIEDVEKKVADIYRDDSLSNLEKIQKLDELSSFLEKELDKLIREIFRLEASRKTKRTEIEEISARINEMEKLGSIRKALKSRELKAKIAHKQKLSTEIAQIGDEITEITELTATFIEPGLLKISGRKDTLVADEVAKEIASVEPLFEKLKNEIFDSVAFRETKNKFIKEHIEQILLKLVNSGEIPEEANIEYLDAVYRMTNLPQDTSKEEMYNIGREIDDFVGRYGLYSRESDFLLEATNAIRYKTFEHEIARIIDGKMDHTLELVSDALSTNDFSTNTNMWSALRQRAHHYDETCPKDIHVWIAITQSSGLRELLGDEISERDNVIYRDIYREALTDTKGFKIDLLVNYPTTETIKTLALLASSKSHGYRVVHASRALDRLSKRSDWAVLVKKATSEYPELESAEEVLKNWPQYSPDGQWNAPAILGATDELALKIIGDENSESALKMLAYMSLSAESFVKYFAENNILTTEQSDSIIEALALLKEEGAKTNQPKYYDYNFRNQIDELLLEISTIESIYRDKERNGLINKLIAMVKISEMINQSKTDDEFVSFLSSEFVESVKNYTSERNDNLTLELVKYFFSKRRGLIHNSNEFDKSGLKIFTENFYFVIKDKADVDFFAELFGLLGNVAVDITENYIKMVKNGDISTEDKDFILEFIQKFRVISPAIINGYKKAKAQGTEEIFLAELASTAETITGSRPPSADERQNPYYNDLLLHIYPNNAGNWGGVEKTKEATDRNGDIADLAIEGVYEIDILSAGAITMKEGKSPNPEAIEQLKNRFGNISQEIEALGFDHDQQHEKLQAELDTQLASLLSSGELKGVDISKIETVEEKLTALVLLSIYGNVDKEIVKKLLITYEFTEFEDIREYIGGTSDRTSGSQNPDYALLCELDEFYRDRIKEVNRHILEKGLLNPAIKTLMEHYFYKVSEESRQESKQDKIDRLQIGKLGTSEGFLLQLGKILKSRTGKEYPPDKVREIIRRYESITHGLQESASASTNKGTKAFYGSLRSQRDKTVKAAGAMGAQFPDLSRVHLGEISLLEYLDAESSIEKAEYNEDQFENYTAQQMVALFSEELDIIDVELDKYVSADGHERSPLHGYITKTKESANARMVGGVCVSQDNPSGENTPNMWDMENFFQLVLQDPETLQCKGLVLLHRFEVNGKKILTASFNPSSTYLQTVDERALFDALLSTLETFAKANNFDYIAVSNSPTIRTNRVGIFKDTLESRIREVNKQFTFDETEIFSYAPNYQMQDLDIIWFAE